MSTGSSAPDRPPPRRLRLYVGVDIGDEARAIVVQVRTAIDYALRRCEAPPRVLWEAPAGLHLSVRFLGAVDDAAADRMRARLAAPFALAPFALQWRGVGVFPGPAEPRVLWMGITSGAAELGALEAAVAARLDGSAVAQAEPLRPRLTLGRVMTHGAAVDWPRILDAIDAPAARTLVSRVTLYRSRPTPRGASYTTVQEAALDASLVTRP